MPFTKATMSQRRVWLDPVRTTPYQFYQFWLNASDTDAEKWIRIFTFLTRDAIDMLIHEHKMNPAARVLQKTLAEEITIRVHSKEDYEQALKSSEILFGKATKENLEQLTDTQLLDIFDGVPTFAISKDKLSNATRSPL